MQAIHEPPSILIVQNPRCGTHLQIGRQKRIAFTVVELLCVIAIIGTLMAMLMPAVQQAREAARNMTCRSHLRQLALGALNYEAAHERLPPGSNCLPYGDLTMTIAETNDFAFGLGAENFQNYQNFSWHTYLLAFLEMESLRDSLPKIGWSRGETYVQYRAKNSGAPVWIGDISEVAWGAPQKLIQLL